MSNLQPCHAPLNYVAMVAHVCATTLPRSVAYVHLPLLVPTARVSASVRPQVKLYWVGLHRYGVLLLN